MFEVGNFRFRISPSQTEPFKTQVTSSEIEIACQVLNGCRIRAAVAVAVVTFSVTFMQMRSVCLLEDSMSAQMTRQLHKLAFSTTW